MGYFKSFYTAGLPPPKGIKQTVRWLDEVVCCTSPTGMPIPEHYKSCPKHGRKPKPVKKSKERK